MKRLQFDFEEWMNQMIVTAIGSDDRLDLPSVEDRASVPPF